MKTRKVMALAGAGVLAVSMMTGCGSSSREKSRSYRIDHSGRFFRIKTAG